MGFNMDVFKGNFERTSAENYEELLKALDVNFLLRKAATVSTPSVEISENNELGEKFDETTPDGRQVSSLATFNDGKLTIVQTAKKAGDKSTKSVREMSGDEMLYTLTVEGCDIVCVQKFKKL